MNPRCLALIGLIAALILPAANGESPARRLSDSGEWIDFTSRVTDVLRIGMTFDRVNKLMEKERPDASFWGDSFTVTNNIGLRRSPMGNSSVLILGFAGVKDGMNIGNEDKLNFVHTVRFSDLKNEIPRELFEPVKLIHLSPGISRRYDPVALVRAVNGLQAVGKDAALKALHQYSKLAGEFEELQDIDEVRRRYHRAWIYDMDEKKLFLIARLLFKRNDGVEQMPRCVPAPQDWEKNWPLYPLAVSDDAPFLMMSGYTLAGGKQRPAPHLDYCEQNCELRKFPMSPASPFRAAEKIFESAQWKAQFSVENDDRRRHVQSLLRGQALRSVEDILGPSIDDYMNLEPNCAPAAENEKTWQKFRRQMEAMKIEWSSEKGRFVKLSR